MENFLDFLLNFSDYHTKNGFYKAIIWGVITIGLLAVLLNTIL